MHRISISTAMMVIAAVAGNFAALRYLDPQPVIPGILTLLLAGLLPLVNAQFIGFQFFVLPLISASLLSAPALLLGLMIGWLTNRFEMALTRRRSSWLPPAETNADTAESASKQNIP